MNSMAGDDEYFVHELYFQDESDEWDSAHAVYAAEEQPKPFPYQLPASIAPPQDATEQLSQQVAAVRVELEVQGERVNLQAVAAQLFSLYGHKLRLRHIPAANTIVQRMSCPSHNFLVYQGSMTGDEEIIIDVNFRERFQLPRSTPHYDQLLSLLPQDFVGSLELLLDIVYVISSAIDDVFKLHEMLPVPPWRKFRSMKQLWDHPRRQRDYSIAKLGILSPSSVSSVDDAIRAMESAHQFGRNAGMDGYDMAGFGYGDEFTSANSSPMAEGTGSTGSNVVGYGNVGAGVGNFGAGEHDVDSLIRLGQPFGGAKNVGDVMGFGDFGVDDGNDTEVTVDKLIRLGQPSDLIPAHGMLRQSQRKLSMTHAPAPQKTVVGFHIPQAVSTAAAHPADHYNEQYAEHHPDIRALQAVSSSSSTSGPKAVNVVKPVMGFHIKPKQRVMTDVTSQHSTAGMREVEGLGPAGRLSSATGLMPSRHLPDGAAVMPQLLVAEAAPAGGQLKLKRQVSGLAAAAQLRASRDVPPKNCSFGVFNDYLDKLLGPVYKAKLAPM